MEIKMNKPKIGSEFILWTTPRKVLSVKKYTGAYPQWFTYVVRVTSDTPRGWTETVI